MNAVLKQSAGELVSNDEFFAPTPYDLIDNLFGQYNAMRARVERLSRLMDAENCGALTYFQRGNASDDSRFPDAARLFAIPNAVKALDSDFWQRTLSLTDVYNAMPQARRDEWNKSIRELATPEYTEDNVRATMETLLSLRSKFLAERVDGIFRGLSGEHVTNSPMAFGKRMIMSYVFSEYGGAGTSKAGLINDLRAIIAKFMGRDEPRWNASKSMLEACRTDHGVWHSLDGGALRIRAYLKGTAHLEVHPDMAWRLNAILHTLYPRAIPANYRVKPAKKAKEFRMMGRPLPFAVLAILDEARLKGRSLDLGYPYISESKVAFNEAVRVLESVGAVMDKNERTANFDYDPREVLREIRLSGCVPDRVSHQFYPTPERVARAAVEMADIGQGGSCLEPSAGQGALAQHMPMDRTTCIEISPLHCTILRAKGYDVTQADFIAWASETENRYSVILMNPPYSEGRWMAHLQSASGLLANGGSVVCILPASARGKDLIPGLSYEWSTVFENEFAGTSIDVAIYKGVRK